VDADGAKVDCPASPYVVLGDYCKFVDQQSLKLQENPETVPTGEMPRHVLLFSERYLVGQCAPGTRVTVTGIYTIFQNKTSYVYSPSKLPLGPHLTSLLFAFFAETKRHRSRRGGHQAPLPAGGGLLDQRSGHGALAQFLQVRTSPPPNHAGPSPGEAVLTRVAFKRSHTDDRPNEETQFRQMARHPRFYEMLWESVAPAIYGNDRFFYIKMFFFAGEWIRR
jgi:DNA replicative helicase MCM subunit Mcm2 (Cdc46/Mcm family)